MAGAGVVIGTFLPWLSQATPSGIEELYGFESDGIITGILGIVVLMIGLRKQINIEKRYSITSGYLSTLISLIALSDIFLEDFLFPDTRFVTSSVGLGIYFTLTTGVLGILGGFMKTPSPADNSKS